MRYELIDNCGNLQFVAPKLGVAAGKYELGSHRAYVSDRNVATNGIILAPSAVDEAFADESMNVLTERGSRRELPAPSNRASGERAKFAIDDPHRGAQTSGGELGGGENPALRSLAEQIARLRSQQEQIRRMLERAEMRAVRS